jgi:heme exporter protein D
MVLGDERPAGSRPATPEGSPLLEFVHPALALLGLTFWIFYVMTGYRTFAWVAFGVVVATVAAGLSWEAMRRRTARRRAGSARGDGTSFPPHLVVLHGLAALCTSALVVITAVVAR